MVAKNTEVFFSDPAKETIKDRLLALVAGRPRRGVAAKWGLKYATLSNYLTGKGSIPRRDKLELIAKAEGVDIDWIINGGEVVGKESNSGNRDLHFSPQTLKLAEFFEALNDTERSALINLLTRKGVETVLYLLDDDNLKLLQLDYVIKEKVLGRTSSQTQSEAILNDEKARECGLDSKNEAGEEILTSYGKRAV
ncbi:hypothetical protein AAH678_21210 [Sodalis endosymbiont of Spalangia cameroni]|uniref:hypothetical protein n=1 Tax=Sodalis praecaptivus TaxID=1239307 RepID=UPI0031F95987